VDLTLDYIKLAINQCIKGQPLPKFACMRSYAGESWLTLPFLACKLGLLKQVLAGANSCRLPAGYGAAQCCTLQAAQCNPQACLGPILGT
jgi:hypothetical protein